MEKTPKEMLKAYVDSQKFNSTTEIMDAMKEMFRDVLQQVMESELDTELGYEKSQRMSETAVESKPRNYRNGYSKKTVKTQLGAVEVKVPRDRNGKYEPQVSVSTAGIWTGWRKNSGAVRLRDKPAEHLGTDQEPVRCGYFAGAGEQDQ